MAEAGEFQSQDYRRNVKGAPTKRPPLNGLPEMQIKDMIYITRN